MKQTALIWFTGVITKYKLTYYTISELQLNMNTLNKLQKEYNLIFLICVKDENEKEQYNNLLKENHLTEHKVLYLPYQFDFDEVLKRIISIEPTTKVYVDYSKQRLYQAASFFMNDNLIHISQLLD